MAYGEADYIIIGGGLTGCALASRLHQGGPSLDILVLESGIDASQWQLVVILKQRCTELRSRLRR